MAQARQHRTSDGCGEATLNDQAVSAPDGSEIEENPGTRITTEIFSKENVQGRQGNIVPPPIIYKMPSPEPDTLMANLFVAHNVPKAPAAKKTFSHPALKSENTTFSAPVTHGLLFGQDDHLRGPKRQSILCEPQTAQAADYGTHGTSDGHGQQNLSLATQVESPRSRIIPPEDKEQCTIPQVSDQGSPVEEDIAEEAVSSKDQQHMTPDVYVVSSSPAPPDRAESHVHPIEGVSSPTTSYESPEANGCYENKAGAVRQQCISDTVLGPNTAGARIDKPCRRQVQRPPGSSSPNMILSGHPSEEDLLLLLVRQNRTRHVAHVELQKRYQTLRQHSARLVDENGRCRQQLTDTTKKWHATIQDHHVLQADVQAFKNRYSKLKKWAMEMHEEYESLRACGDKVNDKISAIKSDIVGDAKNRKDLLEKCQSTIGVFDTLKTNLSELKAGAVELNTTRQQLEEVQARLQEETLQNKNHALYIQRLEKSQRDMNDRFHQKQDQMHQDVVRVCHTVEKYKDETLTTNLAHVLEIVAKIRQQGVLKSADLEAIKNTCITDGQTLTAVEEKLSNVRGEQVDQHETQMSSITALKDILNGLKSELDQVHVLQNSNHTLSKRVHQAEITSKLADREKAVAQLFTSGLLEAHKHVINSRSSTELKEQTNKIEHLRSMNSELHINLQHKSSEALTLHSVLKNLERKAEDLCSQLAEEKAQQEKLQTALNSDRQRHSAELAQSKAHLEAQIAARAQEVADRNDELEEFQQECQGLNAKIAELVKCKNDLESQLQANETQLSSRNNDLERLQTESGLLREQLKMMECTEATLQQLQLEAVNLRETSKRVTQLETENAGLQAAVADRSEVGRLQKGLADAGVKIRKLQPLAEEANSLQQIRSSLEATVKKLEADLNTAQQDTLSAKQLRTRLKDEQARCDKLQNLVTAGEESALKAASLKQELEACRQKNARLEQSVEAGKQDKDKLTKTQTSLQEKTRQIRKLESRLLGLSTVESRLLALTEDSQRKNIELAAMQSRVTKLETENQHYHLLNDNMNNDEVSGLSQEIVLSLKSAVNDQATGEAASEAEDLVARPKRAANRGFHEPSEPVVVPDSQGQTVTEVSSLEGSSEISSPPPNLDLDSMFGNETTALTITTTTTSVAGKQSSARQFPHHATAIPEPRPAASNDDMLLRSSDPADLAQAVRSRITGVLVPASTQDGSPLKTRSGLQVRHGTPVPQIAPGGDHIENFSTPLSHAREQHRPNSAVKRRATHDPNEQSLRMKKPNLKNMEVREQAKTPVSTAPHPPSDGSRSVYDLPSSSRRGSSTIGTNAPTPGRAAKKATGRVARQSTKNKKYEKRFTGSATT